MNPGRRAWREPRGGARSQAYGDGEAPALTCIGWRAATGPGTASTRTSPTRRPAAIAKLTICRPEVRNAFRPQTLFELARAFERRATIPPIGVVILTGQGPDAFCSGGDQRVRGDDGYLGDDEVAERGIGRLNVLDLQIQIRRLPKPVIAMVAGYAIGGGHVLHLVCDLTIAADNARFGQTGPEGGQLRRRLRRRPAREDHRPQDGPRRSGSSAASTTPPRPSTGASSTPSCPSTASRTRPWSGAGRSSPSRRSRFAC